MSLECCSDENSSHITAPNPPKNVKLLKGERCPESTLVVEFVDDNADDGKCGGKQYEIRVQSVIDAKIVTLRATEYTVTVHDLRAGVEYTARVITIRNGVRSAECRAAKTRKTVPDKVKNMQVEKVSCTDLALSWDVVYGADSYVVSCKRVITSCIWESHTRKTNYSLHHLQHGEKYVVSVAASNESGCGQISEEQVVQMNFRSNSRRCVYGRVNHPVFSLSPIYADGVIYNRERDAPGQNCTYIPPGNHNDEKYRLATFSVYPNDVPVKVTDMAAAGFYFTGYKDRVKCFSCGIAVENWMLGDDAMDRKWHKADCLMALGRELHNDPVPVPNFRSIFRNMGSNLNGFQGALNLGAKDANFAQAPARSIGHSSISVAPGSSLPTDISDVTSNFGRVRVSDTSLVLANILSMDHENFLRSLNLKTEADRRKTFKKWPSYPAPFLPSDLAKEGLFYLGNLDRTQCFSCSGVLRNWAPYDNVWEQHEKHFPNCKIVRKLDCGNVPLSDNERRDADEAERIRLAGILPNAQALVEPPDPSIEEQRNLAEYFPCADPVNPHMQTLQQRIESFTQTWPRQRVKATIEAIAKAGFFYLGENDKTKCFYCNGGLQNWDPDDEPWTEHAKWFPGCEFVLRKKGIEFVRRLVEAHPNLNRPYIRNPVPLDDIPPQQARTAPTGNSTGTQQSRINLEQVQSMGFAMDRIQRAIERKAAHGGYTSTEELIQDLLDDDPPMEINQPQQPQAAAATIVMTSSNVEVGPIPVPVHAGLKRENEQGNEGEAGIKKTRIGMENGLENNKDEHAQENLRVMEETSICRKCRKKRVEMVLIPCGHFAVCSSCAPLTKRCPICDVKVASSMKVYRA